MRAKMAVRKKIKWIRGIVYLATNLLNGKQYVGQTMRTLLRRMAAHVASTANHPFANALRKYGLKGFKIEVIDQARTFMALNRKEIFWIKHYDCVAPKGYNLTYGGEGGTPSADTRRKMSEIKKGKPTWNKGTTGLCPSNRKGIPLSKVAKQNVSIGCLAWQAEHDSVWLGKKHKQESKLKMRERKLSEDNKWHGGHHTEFSKAKSSATALAQKEVYRAASLRRWATYEEPACTTCGSKHTCLPCQRRANQLYLLATYRATRNGTPPPEMSEIIRKFRMQHGRRSRGPYKKKVEA